MLMYNLAHMAKDTDLTVACYRDVVAVRQLMPACTCTVHDRGGIMPGTSWCKANLAWDDIQLESIEQLVFRTYIQQSSIADH